MKTASEMLEKALEIALEVHKGTTDKAGAPYILHPLRVALGLEDERDQIVAVLHDVIEDGGACGWTWARLKEEGFPAEILDALECVTKRDGEHGDENYMTFIRRSKTNPIALRVKMADLRDNMEILRIRRPVEKDFTRLKKYIEAYRELAEAARPKP